jgi:hypothetical protein
MKSNVVVIFLLLTFFVYFFFFFHRKVRGAFHNTTKSSNDDVCDETFLARTLRRLGPPRKKKRNGRLKAANLVFIDASNENVRLRLKKQLIQNFENFDKHFLQPFGIDYVIINKFGPESSFDIGDIARELSWTTELNTPLSFKSIEDNIDSVARTKALFFLSSRKTRVVYYSLSFDLPVFLQTMGELGLEEDPEWLVCAERKWSSSYALASAVAAHHLLLDPFLFYYDYTFHAGVDLIFERTPDVNPVDEMERRGSHFFHTYLFPGNSSHSCQENAFEYTLHFSNLTNIPAKSAQYSWCKNTDYFYGNFVGMSSLLRSPAARLFNMWLYECTDGYFKYRWGDQASWPMYICMWLDVPDLSNNDQIADFSSWRGKYFYHPGDCGASVCKMPFVPHYER